MQVQTIAQLTRSIKNQLNSQFPAVWVGGEISGITQPSSGHIYFTLKDQHAQINAIIWRSDAINLNFELTNGLKVICRGGVDVYPQRGSYQLIVRKIQPQGIGALELALRQLQKKLAAEGLFDAAHKKPLPRIPKHIAVVTSPSGAAVRDFLQVLLRRWPNIRVTIVPAKVQGPGAAEEIAAGVAICQSFADRPDAIVVTRGGGSIEDLWAFNEEVVVRTIFASTIPVVSGVGHEIDVTLSDLVADVRALTPSEAAERLVPQIDGVKDMLLAAQQRLRQSIASRFRGAQDELDQLASRPVLTQPLARVRQAAIELDYIEQTLESRMKALLRNRHAEISSLAGRLNAINPLSVLARGYSLTTDKNGALLTDCQTIAEGDRIATRLANGTIESRVERVQEDVND